MFFALAFLTVDTLLLAVAFAYIWLALIPAWIGRAAQPDEQDQKPALPHARGAAGLETLRQRRLPAHRRHSVVLSASRNTH